MATPRNTPATYLHRFLVRLAYWAIWSFFREVRVINEDNLPRHGAVIVACTHHNSALDPSILSTTYPSDRWFHYWVKSGLFANPVLRWILFNAGNISVDRDSKDKRKLFQGTFDHLEKGDAVAVFPEGTSYTEPSIVQVKDGAAWSALEYTAMTREEKDGKAYPPVIIVPASIVYTNKSKYRSAVILEFGKPLSPDAYMAAYLDPAEGAPRAATKHLTAEIERQMIQMSVNAPDWETLNAARMAREILWEDERSIPLEDFTIISQTLVDLFTPPYPSPQLDSVKSRLLTYYALLKESHLTHDSLSALPLPRTLDPRRPTPLPSRITTLVLLVRDTLASLIRLPFFFLPLLVHLPVYAVAKYVGGSIVDEEEIAQGKVFLGLFLLVGTYSAMFVLLWAFFWLTPVGALVAFAVTWAFAVYHVRLVDENYDSMKRLVAAWRVLLGVWAPQSWDIALSSLQLTVRPDKPENKYLKKKPSASPATATATSTALASGSGSSAPAAPASPSPAPAAPTPPFKKRPRLPSRRLVRHVLRNRVLAAQALFEFLHELDRTGGRVTASPHLARAFGHSAPPAPVDAGSAAGSAVPSDEAVPEPHGWRSGREVVGFLRARGALGGFDQSGAGGRGGRGDEWGVLSEEGEETQEGEE